MKKILALILALIMALSLVACGTADDQTPSTSDTPSTNTDTPATNDPGAETPAPSDSVVEPKILKVACFKPETDFMAQQLLKVCEYVKENSNGAIDFEYYMGGSFCSMPEEFGYLSSGAIDMCALMEGAGQATNMLNLFQFVRVHDSCAQSVAVCNSLLNENEETSALLLGQAAENNIIPLGFSIAGVDAFACTKDCDTLEEMSSLTFGCSRDQAFFEALGLNVISVDMADTYESLSRGLIDATSTPVSNMVSSHLYEVAPYVLVSLSGGATGLPTLNLDTWNSLTAEQQQLFRDGYAAAAEWAATEYDNLLAADIKTMEDNGATVYTMKAEDDQEKKNVTAQSNWDNYSAIAEQMGNLEQFTLIFDAAVQAIGATYTK